MDENNLGKLNDTLFAQLDRLNQKNMTKTELDKELSRSKGIVAVSGEIIKSGNLMLQARKTQDDRMNADLKLPKMLEG